MKIRLIIFIAIIMIGIMIFVIANSNENKFEKNREKVLSQLYSSIKELKGIGKYKCCIEPPCTMCYLGDWIWNDGSCDCDGMIVKGEFDKVCPQCKKGLEKGQCKYTNQTKCEI